MQLVLLKPIEKVLSGATITVKVDVGSMAMKSCSSFPEAPASLEPPHQIVSCHTRTLIEVGEGLIPLQRSRRCILQPQLTEQVCVCVYLCVYVYVCVCVFVCA